MVKGSLDYGLLRCAKHPSAQDDNAIIHLQVSSHTIPVLKSQCIRSRTASSRRIKVRTLSFPRGVMTFLTYSPTG